MTEQERGESFVRAICDKRTVDAMGILWTVNKERYALIETKVLGYYQRTKRPVTFDVYLELVKDIDSKEVSIKFQRRSNNFGLDEVSDG